LLGAVGTVLASVALFGTVAHGVTERTREIGVRRALGATSANVVGVVSRDAMGAAIVGAGIGAVGAWLVSRLLRPLLFGVTPNDPWTLGGLAVSVLLVCAVAALFAAGRAVRIEPSLALRSE
jgi:ABC-type antimicrobial peptide transport system permease subunit